MHIARPLVWGGFRVEPAPKLGIEFQSLFQPSSTVSAAKLFFEPVKDTRYDLLGVRRKRHGAIRLSSV